MLLCPDVVQSMVPLYGFYYEKSILLLDLVRKARPEIITLPFTSRVVGMEPIYDLVTFYVPLYLLLAELNTIAYPLKRICHSSISQYLFRSSRSLHVLA